MRALKRMTRPSPASHSSDLSDSRLSFLGCALCEDGLPCPAQHTPLHPPPPPQRTSSPRASSHLPISRPAHPSSPSSAPTPSVLSALSALQSRCAELRLEKRLLQAQVEEAKEDARRREEAATLKGEEALKLERQRLVHLLEEEGRARSQWQAERELWDAGLKRREERVLDMKAKVTRWESEFTRVKQHMTDMQRLAQERDQRHTADVHSLHQQLEAERRRGAEVEGRVSGEKAELQQTMVQLLRDLKAINEQSAALERSQLQTRRVVEEAPAVLEQWTAVKRRRRGKMDSDVLAACRRQEEWVSRLMEAAGLKALRVQKRVDDEREDDSSGRDERPARPPLQPLQSTRAPVPASTKSSAAGRKSGRTGGPVRARTEKAPRWKSAVEEAPLVSPFQSFAPPPPPPRPHSASRPLSARVHAGSRPSSSSSSKAFVHRPSLSSRGGSTSHSQDVSPRSRRFSEIGERDGKERRSQHQWTVQVPHEDGSDAHGEGRQARPRLPDDLVERWGINRSDLLPDYAPMLRSRVTA